MKKHTGKPYDRKGHVRFDVEGSGVIQAFTLPYKLAKLLRMGELPEVHLPSKYSEDLKSLVRYRKSLGEEVTMIKNRIHALLTMHGIRMDATDIFGRKGMREIEGSFPKLKEDEKIVMEDMLKRLSGLIDREREMENRIALPVKDDHRVKLLMAIPGINVYSAPVVISEIDDISRFSSKEKFASYAGLVPKQYQSGTSLQCLPQLKWLVLKNAW